MAALDEYESEYRGHVQAAEEKLALAERSVPSSDATRSAVSQAERAIEAAKDVVQLMELEGRSLSGPARTKLRTRLGGCRDEITKLRARLRDRRTSARSPPEQDRIREECFAGSDRYRDESSGERSRMIANNERMGKATDRLKDAHQVTVDMEETANSILGDLGRQKEVLLHARGTLRFASEGLDTGRRLLNQMARRAAMNKLTLYIVIALLVGMVLLVLWSSSSSGSEPAPAEGSASSDTTNGWQKTPSA